MFLLSVHLHLLSPVPSGRKGRTWGLTLPGVVAWDSSRKACLIPDSSSSLLLGASASLSAYIHIAGSSTGLPVLPPLWCVSYALCTFPGFSL